MQIWRKISLERVALLFCIPVVRSKYCDYINQTLNFGSLGDSSCVFSRLVSIKQGVDSININRISCLSHLNKNWISPSWKFPLQKQHSHCFSAVKSAKRAEIALICCVDRNTSFTSTNEDARQTEIYKTKADAKKYETSTRSGW